VLEQPTALAAKTCRLRVSRRSGNDSVRGVMRGWIGGLTFFLLNPTT
jgi:hypothetical protein